MVGLLWAVESVHVVTTVVPVMNGHPRDQAKVSLHDRRPLVRGTGGQWGNATLYDYPRLSPPAIFILNTCIVVCYS